MTVRGPPTRPDDEDSGRERWVTALVFAAAFLTTLSLVAVVGGVTGLIGGVPVDPGPNGVPLDAPSGPEVIIDSQTEINGTLFPASDTVDLGTLAVQGGDDVTLAVTQQNGSWTNVSNVNVLQQTVTLNPNDKPTVEIQDDIASLSYRVFGIGDGTADLVVDTTGGTTGTALTLTGLPTDSDIEAVAADDTVLASGTTDGVGSVTLALPQLNGKVFLQLADDGGGGIQPVDPTGAEPSASLVAPSDGASVSGTVTLEATVADPDFDDADADEELTVEFLVAGEIVDTQTVTSNQTVLTTLTNEPEGTQAWYVRVTDQSSNINQTATRSFTVYRTGPPSVSLTGPADGAVVDQNVTLSATVADSDFANPTVTESLNVSFVVEGTVVNQTTVSANGTVTADLQNLNASEQAWYVRVTDQQGTTAQSETRSFGVPGTLFIRNETRPDQLVNGSDVNVTVRAFGDDGSVVETTVSDGTVALQNLSVTDPFVVQAEAEGFYSRRTVIKSIFQQQSVYLLNTSTAAIQTTFTVDDRTGDFPNPTIFIKKAINQSGNVSFRTVAADRPGVSGFTTRLEEGARYRVVVENDNGDRRDLGVYSAPIGQSDAVELQIGELSFGATTPDGLSLSYSRPADDLLQFNYSDPSQETDVLEVEIYQRGDEDNVIYQQTFLGPLGNISVYEQLSDAQANETWVVQWTATIDGETVSGSSVLGAGRQPGIPIDPIWLNVMSTGLIVLVAGLVGGGVRAELGAVVTALLAAIFWWLGWLPETVGGGVVVLALLVGGLYYAASTEAV